MTKLGDMTPAELMARIVQLERSLKFSEDVNVELRERVQELQKGLKRALALIDEIEVHIGQEVRGVTYYELKKLV